ncbi:MAG: hypothetical protein KDA58_16660 [Planctomycetaceae bacterium]|nr:hypothetical protein [Planctomycetaceae bacterium]
MNPFPFDVSACPRTGELQEIGDYLVQSLRELTGQVIEVESTHIEDGHWITIDIRFPRIVGDPFDVAALGIISFAIRDRCRHAESVLLLFAAGRRLHSGPNSILNAKFDCTAPHQGWSAFQWCQDTYDEWECETWAEAIRKSPAPPDSASA